MTKISRREFIKAGIGASVGITVLGGKDNLAKPDEGTRPANLVFVFPDEMRRQAVGCMGEDPVITPNLDRLAREGLVMTNAVSNQPLCSPYRAMLMTGKYPHSNGVLTNCMAYPEHATSYLRGEERCISDVLRDAGYSLGYLGKWHLERPHEPYVEPSRGGGPRDIWDEFTPAERRHGFDFWYSYGCYDHHLKPHYWTTEASRDERTEVSEWSVKHEADVAVGYIRNQDGKHRDPERPFALFIAHNPPHMPFGLVPERYVEMYGNRTYRDLLTRPNVDLSMDEGFTAEAKRWVKHYFAAVTGIDEQLGRILGCLREEGLEDDTIIVFTSDHGEMMGSHNLMGKSVWYEESIGVPFIMRWPGRIKAGSRDDLLLGAPDVMPSLLGLMGLADSIPQGVEGQDYSGIFLGKPVARPNSAFYLNNRPAQLQRGRRGVRTMRYTLAIERSDRGQQVILHDNEKDPYQVRNIAQESPALVEELTRELNGWLERTKDPWGKV